MSEKTAREFCGCPLDWAVCFAADCPRAPVTITRGHLASMKRQLGEAMQIINLSLPTKDQPQ